MTPQARTDRTATDRRTADRRATPDAAELSRLIGVYDREHRAQADADADRRQAQWRENIEHRRAHRAPPAMYRKPDGADVDC